MLVQHEKLTTDLPFFPNHSSHVCCRGQSDWLKYLLMDPINFML